MNNQTTPAVEVERHSATALRFATGDLAQAKYVDAKHLDAALARIAELEGDQHQGPPVELSLTSMLNLGWSAESVAQSITDQGPLYRKPPVSYGDTAALRQVYDLIGLDYSQPVSVLLVNFRNMKRFADLLHAVEREFLMVPGEPSEEPEDEGFEPDDECLVNCWGAPSTESYVEQFRTALALLLQRDTLAQAISNAGKVAHLYNSGAGMLAWIEQERKSLAASAEAGGKE